MRLLLRVSGVLVAGVVMSRQGGLAQQTTTQQTATKPKPKTAVKPGMATWSPEVQKTLGVTAEDFNAEWRNKLTPAQLNALSISARPDAKQALLTCQAIGAKPAGRDHVIVTA